MANHNGAGANGAGHNGHHGPREGLYVPFTTQSDVVQDLIGKHDKPSDKWWSGVAAGGILLLLGLIGFAIRMTDGVSDRVVWGYFAMMFAFVLTTAQAAPMVAIAPRIANSHWRRPISARGGDVDRVVGLFNMILFIPMLWILPPLTDGRRSLWFWDGDDPFSQQGAGVLAAHLGDACDARAWSLRASCCCGFRRCRTSR